MNVHGHMNWVRPEISTFWTTHIPDSEKLMHPPTHTHTPPTHTCISNQMNRWAVNSEKSDKDVFGNFRHVHVTLYNSTRRQELRRATGSQWECRATSTRTLTLAPAGSCHKHGQLFLPQWLHTMCLLSPLTHGAGAHQPWATDDRTHRKGSSDRCLSGMWGQYAKVSGLIGGTRNHTSTKADSQGYRVVQASICFICSWPSLIPGITYSLPKTYQELVSTTGQIK